MHMYTSTRVTTLVRVFELEYMLLTIGVMHRKRRTVDLVIWSRFLFALHFFVHVWNKRV